MLEEARQEMIARGIDPTAPNRYKLLALQLLRYRRLLGGRPADDPDTIEISADAWRRLHEVAIPSAHMIAYLKNIEGKYGKISKPTDKDVLEHALACLKAMQDCLTPFHISKFWALPTPLFLIMADVANLISRQDGQVLATRSQNAARRDSHANRVKLTILACATVGMLRLKNHNWPIEKAAKIIAELLYDVGVRKPGGKDGYTAETLITYFRKARSGTAKFQAEYDEASPSELDVPPDKVLVGLREIIRLLVVHRS